MTESLKISTRGQGPDLVLLHGWAMHSGIWGRVVDALAVDFRVNLVDLPGHGINHHLSLPRDLDAVAKQILSEVPPSAWIGWSLGGLVALAAAMMRPQSIEKLVMVSATPSFGRQENWQCGVEETTQQSFLEGLDHDFEETVNQFALQAFGTKHLDESIARLGNLPFKQNIPTKDTLKSGIHLLTDNNLLPDLNKCKTPTLFLGGTRDRTINPESFEQAAAIMPNASSVSIVGAGHAPFISHEDEFLHIIQAFLT
jgi:pimeloyl-[acyl-carrier protein] methyl ester esterase